MPPTVQTTAPDQPIRAQAIDPSHSVIVQAPAGSGKTSLLVQRYINLLEVVDFPEQILAITFTKKAAAEMRERVIQRLAEDSPQMTSIRQKDLSLAWHIASNPNRLKIQTIDSFAMELASSAANTMATGSFTITDQPNQLYRLATHQLLNKLLQEQAEAPLIAEFLSLFDNDANRLIRLVENMLGKRDQWHDVVLAVAQQVGTATPATDAANDHNLSTSAPGMENDGNNIDQLATVLNQTISELHGEFNNRLAEKFDESDEQYFALLAEGLGIDCNLQSIAPTLLTGKDTLRKKFTKREGIDDKVVNRQLSEWVVTLHSRDIEETLVNFTKLPKLIEQFSTIHSLQISSICLALAAAELDKLFIQQNCLDFTGLLMRAKFALVEDEQPTDLGLYLDNAIHHILVDEFQDTSRSQLTFFELLIAGWEQHSGKSFFAVGDPMQSIYRFRDADVAIFTETKANGIGTHTLDNLALEANFRSHPTLVNWINELFANTFSHQEEPELGAVKFGHALAVKSANDFARPASLENVQCWRFDNQQDQTLALAEHIAQLTRIDPSASIAVLCRARGHVTDLLAALTKLNVAYQGTDLDLLTTRPVISDLLALYKTLLTPNDQLAWFALMRSPMFGFSLVELTELAELIELNSTTTESAFPNALENSSSSAAGRLIEAYTWGQKYLYEVPLREVLQGLWLRCGGAVAYQDDGRHTPAADVDGSRIETLETAATFFDLIEDLKNEAYEPTYVEQALERLFANTTNTAQVAVMTIHKSKGLEFDHVIVPSLERGTRSDDIELLSWRPSKYGVLMGIRGDDIHAWLRHEDKQRALNEQKRLLYVACTRAKYSLTLAYNGDDKKRPAGLARFIDEYGTSYDPGVQTVSAENQQSQTAEQDGSANQATFKAQPTSEVQDDSRLVDQITKPPAHNSTQMSTRISADYRWQPSPRPSIDPSQDTATTPPPIEKLGNQLDTEVNSEFGVIDGSPVDGSRATIDAVEDPQRVIFGQLIHRQLAWMANHAVFDLDLCENQLENFVHSLPTKIVSSDRRQAFIEESIRHIRNVVVDEFGLWMLQRHPQAEAEYPLTGIYDSELINIIIDRTFVADGVRWIIDYKTSTPESFAPKTLTADQSTTQSSRLESNNIEDTFVAHQIYYHSEQLKKYATIMNAFMQGQRGDGEKPVPIRTALYFTALGKWVEVA